MTLAHPRFIARLDIKGKNLIKGVHLEGLRVVGDPHEYAVRYDQEGIDEIILMDAVASLYGRNQLGPIIESITSDVFTPVTVGGGIRSLEDVRAALCAGADKAAINTAAVKRPELISEIANKFGSQCMVLSIEAKRYGDSWLAYTDNGREPTGLNVVDWAEQAAELGAGEILLTSIDQEGTRNGFDTALVSAVCSAVACPVVASGGFGSLGHLAPVIRAGVTGVAIADSLHYRRISLAEIRSRAVEDGFNPRRPLEEAA